MVFLSLCCLNSSGRFEIMECLFFFRFSSFKSTAADGQVLVFLMVRCKSFYYLKLLKIFLTLFLFSCSSSVGQCFKFRVTGSNPIPTLFLKVFYIKHHGKHQKTRFVNLLRLYKVQLLNRPYFHHYQRPNIYWSIYESVGPVC